VKDEGFEGRQVWKKMRRSLLAILYTLVSGIDPIHRKLVKAESKSKWKRKTNDLSENSL
jgi:hypothetical protein